MDKIFIILILTVTCITSCNFGNSPHIREEFKFVNNEDLVRDCSEIHIDLNKTNYQVPAINEQEHLTCKLEDLFESLRVVKLETTDDNIIGSIDGITIVNDMIYVLDSWKTKNICVFNIEGKFVRKIGKVGNGPGEYVEPTSFFVNDSVVMVYDQWRHKVVSYDLLGNILSDHWLPFLCFKVIKLENGKVLCFGNDEDNDHLPEIADYKFWVCDSSFSKIERVGYFYEHKKYSRTMIRSFYNYNNGNYYFDYKDRMFYKIKNNGDLELLFSLVFKNELDERFYIDSDFMRETMRKREGFPITGCIMLNNVVAYTVPTLGPMEYVFHNTVDDKLLHFSNTDLLNSDMSRALFLSEIKTCFGDEFVYTLSPERILNINKQLTSQMPDLWEGAPESCREFDKKLLESLHDEDNDILVFAKIKDHFD